jgi:hypothetical protein
MEGIKGGQGLADVAEETVRLVAIGLVTESQFGQSLEYDTDDGRGRQLVVELVVDDRNADKGWLQINYANTYHVDDPRVADLVKQKKLVLSAGALGIYPKEFRRDPKGFDLEKLGGKASKASGGGNGGGHANGNGSHAGQQSKQPAGAAAGVDLNDI